MTIKIQNTLWSKIVLLVSVRVIRLVSTFSYTFNIIRHFFLVMQNSQKIKHCHKNKKNKGNLKTPN